MKQNIQYRALWLIFCLLTALSSYAVTGEELPVVSLTVSDGLTGETVNSIITDHNGITWIATNGGVNTYNGKILHGFELYGDKGQPLEVNALCETSSNIIYAATEDGLYQLRVGDMQFRRVVEVPSGAIVSLLAVGDTVYIGSRHGLLCYDGDRLKRVNVGVSNDGLDNITRQYVVGDDGLIWFLGRYDLNSYNPQTGEITHYPLESQGHLLTLTQFAYVGDGIYIIGTRGSGLYTYNIKTRQMQQVSEVGNLVTTVQRAADGSICVATDGSGAYRLEFEMGGAEYNVKVAEHFHTKDDGRHQLPSNGVYCYYRDSNGVNWFGLVRYGVVYTYHIDNLFTEFNVGDFTTDGINVRTYSRHDNDIIVGTQNGFYYVNALTGSSRFYSPDDLGGGHIINTIAWYEGCFYIGMFDGGLRVFNPQTMTLSHQPFTPLLNDVSIGEIKVGPDGRLWIGSANGLMIVSDGKLQEHFTEQNSHMKGGLVLSITFDTNGNAWLTEASGCSVYDARSKSIVKPNFPKGFFNSMPWMRGAQGHDGLMFFRTGVQTFYTNTQMTDYGELQLPVRFRSKWCRNFIDDRQGNYIVASDRGVFVFDYKLQGVRQFGYGEGLRGSFINDMGLSGDGRLWVATSQGLYFAEVKDFGNWQKESDYKTRLCNIRQGSHLLDQSAEYLVNADHEIHIAWNITSEPLQAEALLMDYSLHKGRIYEYRVDGGDWQLVNDDEPFLVSGLRLGSHVLKVRLAGAAGTESVFSITVLPSGWAIMEILLLMVAGVLCWLWLRYRKNTKTLLRERDEIEDALIESEELRTSEELAVIEETSSKYQKVKIDEQECADIVRRMREYIEMERVYTNQDLKMKDLADVLHLSAPKLSQVFNLFLKENYYEFINRYRLQEFKRLIDEGEYKRYTITALSELCGFKKSNFFSTFRKVEGMTPVEYLKKHGIKV